MVHYIRDPSGEFSTILTSEDIDDVISLLFMQATSIQKGKRKIREKFSEADVESCLCKCLFAQYR